MSDIGLFASVFDTVKYVVENTMADTVWLKMVRVNHSIGGYFSSNGADWIQVGQNVNISTIDSYSDPNFAVWEGTRQGLYVQGTSAYFNLYIYRDAYSPILAECPANQFGTTRTLQSSSPVLDNIYYNNWALYAGVEFGNANYQKSCDSLSIVASSATNGGVVEVYIDSIDAGRKIAECTVTNTGSWTTYKNIFCKNINSGIRQSRCVLAVYRLVYDKLFMLQSFLLLEVYPLLAYL